LKARTKIVHALEPHSYRYDSAADRRGTIAESGSEECLTLWNVDVQSDRRKGDGGALMDRQRSADYFEVRERAYGAAAVGA
jgi:hypothetical protein